MTITMYQKSAQKFYKIKKKSFSLFGWKLYISLASKILKHIGKYKVHLAYMFFP